jgi:hypothetical protein
MRLWTKLPLLVFFATTATGCFVSPAPEPAPYQPAPTDVAVPLGVQSMPGYHVLAGAASELPAGDLGFVVTANGNGGYRLTWSDTQGSLARFSGTITCDTTFDPAQLKPYSGAENLALSADDTTITFDSQPGANVDGVDLVSQSDPIYVDLLVDGSRSGFSIYFTGARSSLLLNSGYDPVAFTSP